MLVGFPWLTEARMETIAELCASSVAFSYRSIDRLILNAYIPRLQTPAAMAVFFREVQHKPILSGHVFKALTDRFVTSIKAFAAAQKIPILHATGQLRPGEVAQQALQSAARRDRWGVVAIVVHQEMARCFASTHLGGRATNFAVKEDRRLVNHYYFYLRDRQYGEGFVRISSYPPFQTRIWMNAHGYIEAQLRRRRVGYRADGNCIVEASKPLVVQESADQFNAALVEQIARRWLDMVPSPLSVEERTCGYATHLSVFQVEFCDNVVFHRTQVLNQVYGKRAPEPSHARGGRPMK
jgi:hypothetical protein